MSKGMSYSSDYEEEEEEIEEEEEGQTPNEGNAASLKMDSDESQRDKDSFKLSSSTHTLMESRSKNVEEQHCDQTRYTPPSREDSETELDYNEEDTGDEAAKKYHTGKRKDSEEGEVTSGEEGEIVEKAQSYYRYSRKSRSLTPPQHHSKVDSSICRHYLAGTCDWGRSCRFRHPSADELIRLKEKGALPDHRSRYHEGREGWSDLKNSSPRSHRHDAMPYGHGSGYASRNPFFPGEFGMGPGYHGNRPPYVNPFIGASRAQYDPAMMEETEGWVRLRTPLVMNVWDDDDGSFTKKKKKKYAKEDNDSGGYDESKKKKAKKKKKRSKEISDCEDSSSERTGKVKKKKKIKQKSEASDSDGNDVQHSITKHKRKVSPSNQLLSNKPHLTSDRSDEFKTKRVRYKSKVPEGGSIVTTVEEKKKGQLNRDTEVSELSKMTRHKMAEYEPA